MATKKRKAASTATTHQTSISPGKQYVGGMGEHLVMAELMARGYNVARAIVDEGIDVIAFKPDQPQRLFRLQVKTSFPGRGSLHETQKFVFTLRKSAYAAAGTQDFYLVLVMRNPDKEEFVTATIPKSSLDDYIADGEVVEWGKNKDSYQVALHLHDNGSLTFKNKSGTDITAKAKDRWDRIS